MDITLPSDVTDALNDAARQASVAPNEFAVQILREQLLCGPTTDDEFMRQLALVELPENRYRADLDLHGRSLEFSSEMLKLALAGIAVVGFFLASIPASYQTRLFSDAFTQWLLIGALIGSAVSVACTLAYRFVAGGATFHHIDYLKMLTLNCRNAFVEGKMQDARKRREDKFRWLQQYLKCSATMLLVAAVFLGLAFVWFMMGT